MLKNWTRGIADALRALARARSPRQREDARRYALIETADAIRMRLGEPLTYLELDEAIAEMREHERLN